MAELVRVDKCGLFCPRGNFHIDPWKPVPHAVITHAHSDHAREGSQIYYCAEEGAAILRYRLGAGLPLVTKKFGEPFKLGEVTVSFHPAGHILGSSQIRIHDGDQVWVFSGDYKRTPDASCRPFEVVPCDVFISEATFALPVYHWESGQTTAKKIYEWWQSAPERPSLIFCYALGKAQRILAELAKITDKKIYLHGAIKEITEIYRQSGVQMLPTELVSDIDKKYPFAGDLILAPPSAHRSPWMKRFKDPQTAFASGWMQVRGARRRRGYEKGFVLSDHADWNELIQTVQDTGAKTIYLTHGRTDVLERYLEEKGLKVRLFQTEYSDHEEAS